MRNTSQSPKERAASGLTAVLLALAAFATVTVARAAEKSAAPPDTAKPVMFLKETLVTGSRYPRAYYESPQALSFVTRTQLRQQQPTVVGDALAVLPGVDNSKDSPWEQRPVVRGLSGQRVLVMMDGNPMNTMRGNGAHPSLVDPAQVERVEVVRGPTSVAYGSDALGGVINIITRQAPATGEGRSLKGSATVGGSSADQQRSGYLELIPRIGKFSAFVSTGARKADDFDSPNGTVKNSAFSDYNALANLRYDFSDRLALKGGWQLYRANDVGIPGLSFEMPGATQQFQFAFYDRDAAHLQLEHKSDHGPFALSTAKVYWQQEHRDFYSDQTIDASLYNAFGIPPRAGSSSARTAQDRYLDVDTYGFQAQAASARTEHYRYTAGLDLGRDVTGGDNVRFRTYHDAAGAPVGATGVRVTQSLPDGRFDNYGGYGQGEWYLNPQWTLSGGGRYTHYRYRTDTGLAAPPAGPPPAQPTYFAATSTDDDAVAGSVGAVYALGPDLRLSANVANGYRQPNAQDLFFSGAASVGYVIGNPDLKPEKSVSSDVGLRWGPGPFAVSGNVYYSTYDDLIDAISVPPVPAAGGQPTYQYVNISSARIWGMEGEAELRFHRQWIARAQASGVVGDITSAEAIQELYGVTGDSAPLPNVPPFRGSASLRWKDKTDRFWVEPGVRYSWRTNRLPLPTPGVPQIDAFKKEWIVGDVMAGARFGGQRLLVGVRNFTDTPFQQALGSLEEPGVSFVGSISADF
jgi:hemoglobin/transferrin/lactoferrin receptor protein